MDEPQKDLIEQIISASLARQSAARKQEAGERDGAPGPAETPPAPRPSALPPTPRSAPPPRAGRGLVWLTAALAMASAVLLVICLTQLRAQREAADGLREAVEAVQSVDGLREEREQLREETARLQQEMEQLQWQLDDYRETQERLTNSVEAESEAAEQTADTLWTVLLARELFDAGEYENCALILQGLVRSGQQEVNRTSYIDGEVRDVKSILDGMAAELEEMGYLSQEDAQQIGDKFVLVRYG